jgi:hypothetical protein
MKLTVVTNVKRIEDSPKGSGVVEVNWIWTANHAFKVSGGDINASFE